MAQSFSALDVIAQLRDSGVARPSRFMVEFVTPPAFTNYPQVNDEVVTIGTNMIRMWCEAANLPGVALEYYPVRRYGYGAVENKPTAPKFTDVNLRMRLDAGGVVHGFMHAWMRAAVNYNFESSIQDANGSTPGQHVYELGYKEDYACDVTITQFDDAGNDVTRVTLRDAYPVYVGDVPLDWGSISEYSRLPVTLTFIGWHGVSGPVAKSNVPETKSNVPDN